MNLLQLFRRLVHIQVTLGVIAYAFAEQSLATVLVAGILSTMSWYMVEGPRGRPLAHWIILIGVLAVTLWLFYTQLVRHDPLVIALGDYILFMQLLVLFQRKGNSDYAQLIVLSFMQMICASIISVSIIFALVLAIYLVVAMVTTMLFQLKLGHDEALGVDVSVQPPRQGSASLSLAGPGWSRQFRWLVVVCALCSVTFSGAIFLAMPRGFGAGMLGELQMQGRRPVSGFAEEVVLTGGGLIATSQAPIMNVTMTRNGLNVGSSETSFLMRGVALDQYDPSTRKWTQSTQSRQTGFNIPVHKLSGGELVTTPQPGSILSQEVTLRASTKGTLFGVYPPIKLRTQDLYQFRFNPFDQTLHTVEPSPASIHYVLESREDGAQEETYRKDNPRAKIFDWAGYSRRPVLPDARIQQEATRILAEAGLSRDPQVESDEGDHRAAGVVERSLQAGYTYTLQLPEVPPGTDPIVGFLFNHRQGHCEYFASAMCALMRSIGVRSRVVTGFRASEFNPLGQYYVVRDKNAHAWVEVWAPGTGWRSFDPSPPAVVERLHRPRGILAALRDLYEYLDSQWINKVVTYDAAQRDTLLGGLDQRLEVLASTGKSWSERLNGWAKAFHERWMVGPMRYLLLGVGVPALLLGLWLLMTRALFRDRTVQQLRLDVIEGPRQRILARQLAFYIKMLAILKRAGHVKPPGQTPAAFAQVLAQAHPDRFAPLVPLTSLFYEIRFGGRPLDGPRAGRAQDCLQELRHGAKKG